ncbi:hypothetical protein Patl1_35917 [Pistacia atlantica]|nr:hypothetical protein Patl1_35917 [Pistacia atlantica]
MGSTEEDPNKPLSLYEPSSPSQPLLSKPPIEEHTSVASQPDPQEPDPVQFIQINYNYGPRPFKDLPFLILFVVFVIATFAWGSCVEESASASSNWGIELTIQIIGVASDALSQNLGLFVALPLLTLGLIIYYAPIIVFLVFARFNGKIVAKESSGEYECVWKQDSWVPAYFAVAILTMLWSLSAMVEAQAYVISGTIAQWNAFGPSSGTVCLSGLLICAVRIVRAAVDSARQEDVPGFVILILRCCVNALLSAVDFLNKFTINFAAITGEAYCTSARMTYELLKRNLLSAVFVETVSTRLLAGIIFVVSAIYTIAVCAILKGATKLGAEAYFVGFLAWVLLIMVLGIFVHVLDNVIETVYVCYAIDRDKGEVYKPEVHAVYVHVPLSRNHRTTFVPTTLGV